MNTSFRRPVTVLAVASTILVGACQGGERSAGESDSPAVSAGTDTMQGTEGMGGMEMQGSAGMMSQMDSHMAMMDGASADSMRSMLPMHRQMAANMLAEMNREMRGMNMSGDAAWTATMDSVRQDLVTLPELSGPELKAFMPAHHRRLMRLMEAHRAMMAHMQM